MDNGSLLPVRVPWPGGDGLVIAALERWASGEAARIMVGLFLVAAVVTAVAAIPALALGGRRARMLASGPETGRIDRAGPDLGPGIDRSRGVGHGSSRSIGPA